MKKNKAATNFLTKNGRDHGSAELIVNDLIWGGFLTEDAISKPERYAQAARDWVGDVSPQEVFDFATGWNTDSWEAVTRERLNHDPIATRNIFFTLVILAKEAGVGL